MATNLTIAQEVVIDLLAEAMSKESTGFLVDGFPATMEQVGFTRCYLAVFQIFDSPTIDYIGGSTIQDNFSGSSLKNIDHALIPPVPHSHQAQLFEKTVGSPVKIIVFEMNDELMRVRLEGRGNFDDRKDAIRFLRIFACSKL